MSYEYNRIIMNDWRERMDKIKKGEVSYEYSSYTESGFSPIKKLIDDDEVIDYVKIDNILVGERVHSQYIFDINNSDKLERDIKGVVNKLKSTISDLEEALWWIKFKSSDLETKYNMMRIKKIKTIQNKYDES